MPAHIFDGRFATKLSSVGRTLEMAIVFRQLKFAASVVDRSVLDRKISLPRPAIEVSL
jgi:hypothetical protein